MEKSLIGSLPYKEVNGKKVFYRGQYRIIAQIVHTLQDKEPFGFIVMDDKTKMMKRFRTSQVKFLMSKYPFINAELENGKIRCTEGKLDNLMKFDMQGNRISEPKITILGEKVSKTDKQGEEREFKVLSADLVVLPGFYKESEVVKMIHLPPFNGMDSITNANKTANGRIVANVTRNSRDEEDIGFVKILEENIEENPSKKEVSNEWRKERHRQKLLQYGFVTLLHKSLDGHISSDKYSDVSTHINKKKELKIIISEIEHFGILEKARADNYDEALKYVTENINSESMRTLRISTAAICQYSLYIPQVYKDFYYSVYKKYLAALRSCSCRADFNRYVYERYKGREELHKRGIDSKILNEVINRARNEAIEYARINGYKGVRSREEELAMDIVDIEKRLCIPSCRSFSKAKEIAELGFCVHEKYKGQKYKSSYGRNYSLKYVGDFVPNYEEYFKMVTTFGDVACIAQIERAIEKKGNHNDTRNYTDEQNRQFVEMLFGILAIYRPDIAKKYWDERLSLMPEYQGILPDFDFSENRDYGLNPKLKLYYDTGFNAYYLGKPSMPSPPSIMKDLYPGHSYAKDYAEYKKSGNDVFIVYRAFYGTAYPRKPYDRHGKFCFLDTVLFNDLIAILGVITSENCSIDFIERHISNLRMM